MLSFFLHCYPLTVTLPTSPISFTVFLVPFWPHHFWSNSFTSLSSCMRSVNHIISCQFRYTFFTVLSSCLLLLVHPNWHCHSGLSLFTLTHPHLHIFFPHFIVMLSDFVTKLIQPQVQQHLSFTLNPSHQRSSPSTVLVSSSFCQL